MRNFITKFSSVLLQGSNLASFIDFSCGPYELPLVHILKGISFDFDY